MNSLTPELLLAAYAEGFFPMAQDAAADHVEWYCPQRRGQISISDIHISKKLKKAVTRMEIGGIPYEITINQCFDDVMKACAQQRLERPVTWINDEILKAYSGLHEIGHAHSVECWQGGEMVGGLYGVSIGAAFFGESMFSTVSDASKVSLVHLVARLWHAGFEILDTQYVNDHLMQFGVYEVEFDDYMVQLSQTLGKECDFMSDCSLSQKQSVLAYLQRRGE